MSELNVGMRVLERYRIVQALGSGGMGVVYLGRTEGAEGFTRPVVIKRLLDAFAGEREHNHMFVREARILSNLQHPNIVSVVDFGLEDGDYVMILDYVHGYDLDQWSHFVWRAGRAHSPDHVLLIARRVLAALQYAHSLRRPDGTLANIVHRDVSLSNILLDAQAQVKLHDFGIARMEGGSETPTEDGIFKGKVGLAAPELLLGERASPRTDLYSVGVITYHLLSGAHPFRGKDAANTMYRVLHHTPDPLASRRDDLPLGLDEVLGQAMHKDPDQRFQSAEQFARALAALCSRSDDEVTAEMAGQLVQDFASMPRHTNLQSLEARDAAWRAAVGPEQAAQGSLSSSPPSLGLREAATVFSKNLESISASEPTAPTAPGELGSAPSPRRPSVFASGRARLAMLLSVGLLALAAVYVAFARAPAAPMTRYLVLEKPSQPPEPASTTPVSTPEAALSPAPALAIPMPEGPRRDSSGTTARKAPVANEPAPRRPDPDALTREFRQHQPRVESCVNRHVEQIDRHPEITVRFEVNAAGKVTDARLSPALLAGTPLGACILDVARSVRFRRLSEAVAFSIPITARRSP